MACAAPAQSGPPQTSARPAGDHLPPVALADALVPGLLELVPTFECVSVYAHYSGDRNGNGETQVDYRELPGGRWIPAHETWADRGDGEFRVSLIGLQPDTDYDVRVVWLDPEGVLGSPLSLARVRTWSEQPPIGNVQTIAPGTYDPDTFPLQSGTAQAWQVYQAAQLGDVVFHDSDPLDWGFSVSNREYIVFRNLVFTGGRDAVVVYRSHHIRFENCEMRDFGDAATPTRPHRGIVLRDATCQQVVVQDCWIHSPAGNANDWGSLNWNNDYHPDGPYGVWFWESGGNHVIRRNRIEGDDLHWWSDGICGTPNGGVNGGPHRDSDIYDNLVHHVNDDGIELDGGQMNVRCFGNEIRRCYVAISTAPCIEGPSYIYRNVVWDLGDARTPPQSWTIMKLGGAEGDPGVGKGSQYIYHNTFFMPYDPGGNPPYDLWIYAGVNGTSFGSGADARRFVNVTMRNNIVLVGAAAVWDQYALVPTQTNSYDYDLAHQALALALGPWPPVLAAEEHGVHAPLGTPLFVSPVTGDFHLLPGCPAVNAGVGIPGFGGGVLGLGPDLGAFEDW